MNFSVAVIIAGHFRTFDDCWPTWLDICKYNNFLCDYYVHSYDKIVGEKSQVDKRLIKSHKTFENENEKILKIIDTIQPCSYVIDSHDQIEKLILKDYEQLKSCKVYKQKEDQAKFQLLQAKKMQVAYNLYCLEKKKEYDLLIRLRTDFFWKKQIKFILPEKKELSIINRGSVQHSDTACDIFGIMKSDVAEIYFNLYDTMLHRAKFSNMRKYNLEVHLGMLMKENNIKILENESCASLLRF